MVKLQKPIPKKLGSKVKLDNPIKKKKQQIEKEKSASTVKSIKVNLLESPIKEVKAANKPGKLVAQTKKNVPKQRAVSKLAVKDEKKPVGPIVPQKLKEEAKPKKSAKKADVKAVPVKNGKLVAPVKAPVPAKVVKDVVKAKSEGPVKAAASNKKIAPSTKPTVVKSIPLVKERPQVKETAPAKLAVQKKAAAPPPVTKTAAPTQKQALAAISKIEPPTKGPVAPSKLSKGKKKKNKKAAAASTEPAEPVVKPKIAKKVIRLQDKKKAKIAFRLAKQNADESKEKKDRPTSSIRYEPIPYDEEKFNSIVNVENIKKIAEALKTQVEKEVATKKSSIFDDYRYFLQVGSFKIPNCPKRMVKLNLKHSLVDKDDDVLLIVPDLQRGAKVDYEPTIHHYEDVLRFHGVQGITVMPMNQLRKEFGTFEQKRRLCASYEHFLCDGRIVSHVVGIVGKTAQKPRCTFHAVRLHEEKDIKTEIEKALRKTAYRQLAKSSLQAIPVGTHKFTSQQLADNIKLVVDQLKKVFPGGLGNIRNLYLKIDITGTSSLPLYVSMAQAPEQTPMVVGPREQRMIKLKREANEVLSKFAMTKEGKLIKLTKPQAEKKRKLQEMRATLKEDEEVSAKKAKKSKKETEKKKKDEVKELELPENEEDDDDDSSDEDDDDVVQLGSSSDDDEDNDDMGQLDQEEDDDNSLDAGSDTEIVENGLVDIDEEEDDEEDLQDLDGTDGDDDEDEEDEEGDEDDDDDDDSGEGEESD